MKSYILPIILFASLWSCKSLAQTNLDSTLEDYQQEILGVWVLENDPETKFEFLENGIVNTYYGDEIRTTENYIITNSCDGEIENNGHIILKQFNNENDFFCSYIEGLNFEGNNIMSLMTFNQGKIVVFVRP